MATMKGRLNSEEYKAIRDYAETNNISFAAAAKILILSDEDIIDEYIADIEDKQVVLEREKQRWQRRKDKIKEKKRKQEENKKESKSGQEEEVLIT